MSDAVLARIAAAYGITVAELSMPPEEAERARQLHRVMTLIPRLDEDGLRLLAEMAERLPRRSDG